MNPRDFLTGMAIGMYIPLFTTFVIFLTREFL